MRCSWSLFLVGVARGDLVTLIERFSLILKRTHSHPAAPRTHTRTLEFHSTELLLPLCFSCFYLFKSRRADLARRAVNIMKKSPRLGVLFFSLFFTACCVYNTSLMPYTWRAHSQLVYLATRKRREKTLYVICHSGNAIWCAEFLR